MCLPRYSARPWMYLRGAVESQWPLERSKLSGEVLLQGTAALLAVVRCNRTHLIRPARSLRNGGTGHGCAPLVQTSGSAGRRDYMGSYCQSLSEFMNHVRLGETKQTASIAIQGMPF